MTSLILPPENVLNLLNSDRSFIEREKKGFINHFILNFDNEHFNDNLAFLFEGTFYGSTVNKRTDLDFDSDRSFIYLFILKKRRKVLLIFLF